MKCFNIIYTISIVAIIHGFFLTVLLFSYKRGNIRANRLFGLFMFSFSIILSYTVLYHTPFVFICFAMLFLLGPIFYLYVKHLTRPDLAMDKKSLFHTLPFLLVLSYMIFIIFGGYYNVISTKDPSYNIITIIYWAIILGAIQVQIISYLALSLALISKHKKRIINYFSTLDIINLSWIQHFLIALIIVLASSTILTIILPGFGFPERECDMAASLFISLFIFAMGYRGLVQPEIFTGNIEQFDITEKYQKSNLNSEEAGTYLKEIYSLMEKEKIYTDPEITLNTIAERISVSRHLLSMILNEIVKMNFYDFINRYRIEQVKLDLEDKEMAHCSILEVAYNAGFNSKSTFNAVFKKQTGMTPSQYRNQQLRME